MISIVTVNFKTKTCLEKMLASLFEQNRTCDMEVLVVENASGDDLRDIEPRFPTVRFIYADRNLGFAGGCNAGMRETKGEYVLLVNPDIIFDSDAVCQIEKRMNDHPDVAIGGINLKNPDGTQQACVWRFPTPLDQILLLLKVPHVFPNIGPIQRWLMKDFDYTKTADVDQVMGAFFCIRRSLIEQIGLFDDGFFMWYEEVDYCRRAVSAGSTVRYFADVSVRHQKGSSFASIATLKKQAMVRKSLRRYMRKHFGFAGWLLFSIPEPIFFLVAFITSLIKPV